MRAADPDRVLQDVGRRIAEVRRDRGLTQEQFSALVGVSVRYLQFVEAGQENLGVATVVKFANALKVSIVDLFSPPTRPRVRGRPKKQT